MEQRSRSARVVQAIALKGDAFLLEVLAGLSDAIRKRRLLPWEETAHGEFERRTEDGVLIAIVYRNKKKWVASITREGRGLRDRHVSQHQKAERAMKVLDAELPRYGWKVEEDPGPP